MTGDGTKHSVGSSALELAAKFGPASKLITPRSQCFSYAPFAVEVATIETPVCGVQ
jgi:hypothetical protein